jgi:hypothetical protein
MPNNMRLMVLRQSTGRIMYEVKKNVRSTFGKLFFTNCRANISKYQPENLLASDFRFTC